MLHHLFKPICPCDPSAKVWVEERLRWLSEQFNDSVFSGRQIILPTPDFFPDRYDGSPDTVRKLLDRVCGYMDVSPDLIDLHFLADAPRFHLVNDSGDAIGHAAGTYHKGNDQFVINLSKSQLDQPMALVATMAHELAHVRLLGENRILRETFDNELLTDLTVVHLGLGIFLANTPRHWDSHYSHWPGTKLLKPEYMTPPMFGWALAHLAVFRDEDRFAKHLRSGARSNLRQGVRYLLKTSDSSYQPGR